MLALSIAPKRSRIPGVMAAFCCLSLAVGLAPTADAKAPSRSASSKTASKTAYSVSAKTPVAVSSTSKQTTSKPQLSVAGSLAIAQPATTTAGTDRMELRAVGSGALTADELCAMEAGELGSNLHEPGGSALPCPESGPLNGTDGYGSSSPGSNGQTTPGHPYAGVRAYDLFDPTGNGFDHLRSYLLSVASMSIYTPLDYEANDPWGFLTDRMSDWGMETEVIEDVQSDTQSALFSNDEVVILSFRGTESNSDRWTDLQNWFRSMPPHWGENVSIHNGFIASWETVRPRVLDALKAHEGKALWVTGHSLGGALAVVAAYDIEAVNGVEVEGVHTFGSPRVGNANFKTEYDDSGLAARTHRWQIEGDPIPSYFPFAFEMGCTVIPPQCSAVAYPLFHVGRTHDVFVSGPSPDFDYELDAFADDHVLGWHLAGGMVEHVKYDDMFIPWLEEEGDTELFDILPPLPVDVPPSD